MSCPPDAESNIRRRPDGSRVRHSTTFWAWLAYRADGSPLVDRDGVRALFTSFEAARRALEEP